MIDPVKREACKAEFDDLKTIDLFMENNKPDFFSLFKKDETPEEFYDRMRERDTQIPSDLTCNDLKCDETTYHTNEDE